MPVPPFIKSPTFLSGLGVFGSGAIGVGGGQLVEEVYPVGDQRLSKLGFHSHEPKPELGSDVDTGSHSVGENPFKFQSYGCFQNFFPGATVNHSFSDTPTINDSFVAPPRKDIDSETNPIGCALMNLSYETNQASGRQEIKYIFKAEVTAKNDRFGGSLWAGTKRLINNSSSNSQSIAYYYLTFLKRNSYAWSVLGGYSWLDYSLSQENLAAKTNIFSPKREDGNGYLLTTSTSESKQKLFKKYAGVGEVTTGGNEIFQDIELWAEDDSEKYASNEILGRDFKKGTSDIDFAKEHFNNADYGYEDTEYVYSSDSGGAKISTKKDITQTLNDMYSPFKGKKGKGREVEEYCNSQRFKRTSKGYLYTLQNFCYKK